MTKYANDTYNSSRSRRDDDDNGKLEFYLKSFRDGGGGEVDVERERETHRFWFGLPKLH